MIQERSILKVADNSGAKTVRCFRIPGGSKRRYAEIGDIVIASVQKAEPRKTVKKKDIVRVLIIRQRKPLRRSDGSYIRFDDNAVVLVDKKEPRAKAEQTEQLITLEEERLYREGTVAIRDLLAPSAFRVETNFIQLGETFLRTIFVIT